MSALKTLTHQIVDYAGLFPPAGLPMEQVVANYATYVQRADSAMLARLIIPVGRLAEFEEAAGDRLPEKETDQPWRISGLIPPVDAPNDAFKFALSGIEQFNKRHKKSINGLAMVDVVEIKTPTRQHIIDTCEKLSWDLKAFLEVPHDDDPADLLDEIAAHNSLETGRRFFAKIRTGGVTPDLIPTVDQVSRFISACAERFVGFKATAGLHHPLRNEFRLTYEADAATGVMHGFLNVFVAACFAFAGYDNVLVSKILNTGDAGEFRFDRNGITFENQQVTATKIAAIRNQFALSFGSCSFDEPTAELDAMGFETAATT